MKLWFGVFLCALTILAVPRTAARQLGAPASSPLFREAAAETGLVFRHFIGAMGAYRMPEIMGSGVALFDYDNDGDLDVYLVQGAMLDEGKSPAESRFPPPKGWKPGNRLFRNEQIPSGRLSFTDVTERAGVGLVAYGMGVATGDFDNDGFVDLYVTNFGSNVLYRNNGQGGFTDVTREAGVDDPRWSTSAAFLDYDRDGRLDLFVCNYLDFTSKGNKRCETPAGEPDYCAPNVYRPVPARLFHNEGGGKFVDATQASGIGAAFGAGLGVSCADFNGDGWIDVYVANDGSANLLWINRGDGTFEERGLMAGAAYAADGAPRAGMGIAAADFDNDGLEDLLVTNLTRQGSTFFRNLGKGLFDDASAEANLARPSFPYTGFGVGGFDYDNDGWLDVFAANGAVTLLPALRGEPYPYRQRNQLFHNEAGPAGRRVFRDVTAEAGPALRLEEVSRAAAFGDIDNDGDIDVLVANNNGPARLLLNQTPATRRWLAVKPVGVVDNRDGIGARVAVLRTNAPPLWRRAHTDGSYLAASDPRVHFGLGTNASIEAVGILWPDGRRERWPSLALNALHVLKQGSGSPWPAK